MRSTLVVVGLVSSLAFAQAATPQAPSAEAVRDTWNFFLNGKGKGLVVVDFKLCSEIAKDGPNKFDCIAEVKLDEVKVNSPLSVWQAYLVPQGDSIEDLTVQIKQGNIVRETKDVKVKGETWRTRQWTGVRITKPGDWTISLMRGDQLLKELRLKAK